MIQCRYLRLITLCSLTLAVLSAACTSEPKVGAVISRSGSTAPYGESITKGIDLALEEINAGGGFDGTPVQVVYRDDQNNPDKGVEAVLDLSDNEGIEIIIGAVGSDVTLRIAELCEERGIVLLSPSASAPELSSAGDYIFRNYPSDVIEGTAMADFAKGLGVKEVLIFSAGRFGKGLTEVFKRQFESRSRKVVEVIELQEHMEPEALAPLVEQAKELKPQGIYILAYVNETATLLRQLKESGVDAVLMGSGAITGELPGLAGDAVENVVYAAPSIDVESTDKPVADFVKAYRAKYNEEPDIYAAQGYDALHLLVRGMEEGGMAHPDSVKLGLLNLDHQGAAGRSAFDEKGDVTRYPQIFVFRQGVAVPYEKFTEEGGSLPVPGGSS